MPLAAASTALAVVRDNGTAHAFSSVWHVESDRGLAVSPAGCAAGRAASRAASAASAAAEAPREADVDAPARAAFRAASAAAVPGVGGGASVELALSASSPLGDVALEHAGAGAGSDAQGP